MPQLKEEQLDIINHQSGDILVSASAGAGKTFVMIERLIRLITEKHATVNDVLAVTFTEAAATEMKERLKTALAQKIAEGRTDLSEQLNEVASADISTLHGFCSRLIRSYFFVAGVSPDFKIADASESKILKDKAISKLMRKKYDENSNEFNAFLGKFLKRRSDSALRETIQNLFEFANTEADPEKVYSAYKRFYTPQGYEELCKDFKSNLDKKLIEYKATVTAIYKRFNEFGLKKSAEFCLLMLDDINKALKGDAYSVKQFENYSLRLSFENKLTDEPSLLKEKASAIRNRLKVLFKNFCKGLTDKKQDEIRLSEIAETTEYLVQTVREYGEIYSNLKADENVLDFNDLEHFALKVLSDEKVKTAVRDKYKFVFVDEYQDTNGVQEAIISKVSDNNLFMVGDVKQSIYGFRGCNPDIFANKMEEMQKQGKKTAVLNYNFRSAEKVIDLVNEIFSYCMKKDNFGEDYSQNSTLKTGGIYGEDNVGRATVHVLLKDEKRENKKEHPRVYDILEEIRTEKTAEHNGITSLIAKIIKDELGKTYYDPKEKKHKRITFGDIVILTRSRKNSYVEKIVDGLKRHGINIFSEVSEDICSYPEVQVLINALRLVDCFKSDVPLATVMKSPIGGFTEEELAEIVLFYTDNKGSGGFYDAYEYYLQNADGELYNKVKAFDEYFRSVRYVSDFIGAKGVLNKLINDSMYLTYVSAERSGDLKLKRIKHFISLTESNGYLKTVSEVLNAIDNSEKAFEVSFNSDKDDVVRVMTIHASKGLEFPVVIVCGLERRMNTSDMQEEVLADRDCGFALKYYDTENKTYSETVLRSYLRQKMQAEQIKEEMRLFYVATTRASYSLHLTLEGDDNRTDLFSEANKMLDYLPETVPIQVHNPEEFDFINLTKDVKQVVIGRPDEEASRQMQKNFSYVYPYFSDTVLPLKTNVTEIVKSENYKNAPTHTVVGGQTDQTKGTLAHRFLELVDFNRLSDIDGQKRQMTDGGLISEKEFESITLDGIKKVFCDCAFKNISDKQLYREKSFMVNVPASMVTDTDSAENILVQGVIDLLAIDGEQAEIFDYKYSESSSENLEKRYKKQLELYAYAVEKVLKKKVTAKYIVNIFTGDVIKIS